MPKHDSTNSESFGTRLQRTCEGLNFVSETDSEVVPVFGGEPLSNSILDVLAAVGVSPSKHVTLVDPEQLFSRLTTKKEWFNEGQRANAASFKALKVLLDEELDQLKVFKVGKIRVTIYVLGSDREGKIVGVKMKAVET